MPQKPKLYEEREGGVELADEERDQEGASANMHFTACPYHNVETSDI